MMTAFKRIMLRGYKFIINILEGGFCFIFVQKRASVSASTTLNAQLEAFNINTHVFIIQSSSRTFREMARLTLNVKMLKRFISRALYIIIINSVIESHLQ